jgi:hypothetical protein
MTVHQAVQYPSSGWLADGSRNSGDCSFRLRHNIHTLMVDELSIHVNWQTDGDGSGGIFSHADNSLSSKRGGICEKLG